MAGDAGAMVKHLDQQLGDPHLDDLADQSGRYRIEVTLHFDVVVRRHPGASPFGVLIGFGWQRQKRRPVDLSEELAAALAELAHQAGVEFFDQPADGRVQVA